MKKISIWLICAMLWSLIQPFAEIAGAEGAAPTMPVTIKADSDITFDYTDGGDPNGELFTDGDLYVGRLILTGNNQNVNNIERSALRFNLSSISGVIDKAILKFHFRGSSFNENVYMDIWGSNEDVWPEGMKSLPSYNASDMSSSNYVRLGSEFFYPDSGVSHDITVDVTDLVKKFGTDGVVTLVMTGKEDEPRNDSRITVVAIDSGDPEEDQPRLEITTHPNSPPTGSISINGGKLLTNSADVTLNVIGEDPDQDALQMRFSNDNVTWSGWEPYQASKPWRLSGGDGAKTVYMELKDASETVASSAVITLDTIPPIASGVFNGGSYNHDLSITFDEGQATLDRSPYTSGVNISAEGKHHFILTDEAGNETKLDFTIDKTKPAGTLVINEGAKATNAAEVTLSLTSSDPDGSGVSQMQFSDDDVLWSPFEPVASSRSFTLTAGDGVKTVYVRFKDEAGNVSDSVSAQIALDTTPPQVTGVNEGAKYNVPPEAAFGEGTATLDGKEYISGTPIAGEGRHILIVTDDAGNMTVINFMVDTVKPEGSIQINNGEAYTRSLRVTLSLSSTDQGGVNSSGLVAMQFSDDQETWSEFEPVAASKNYDLPPGDGIKAVYVRFKDEAGNVSDAASSQITLDTTPPRVTGAENNKLYNNVLNIFYDEGTGTLDGKSFVSGSEVSGEGTHTLVVVDAAGNTTTIIFTIDVTAPVVTGVHDQGVYNSDLHITYNEGTALLDGTAFASGATVALEGEHTLVVTDEAGNATTIRFTLDKTKPTGAIAVHDGAVYTVSNEVTLTVSSEDPGGSGTEYMQFSEDGTIWSSEEPFAATKTYAFNGDLYGLKTIFARFKDRAGNSSDISQISIERVQALAAKEDTDLIFSKDDFHYDALQKIKVISLPNHGTLKWNDKPVAVEQEIAAADLSGLKFIPDQDWHGLTAVEWLGSDGTAYDAIVRTLVIDVAPVEDAPVAKDLKFSVSEGTEYSGSLSGFDADGDPLTYEIVKASDRGKVTLTDASKGTFRYEYPAGSYGTHTFTYRVFDGKGYSNTAAVFMEVLKASNGGNGNSSSGGGGSGSSPGGSPEGGGKKDNSGTGGPSAPAVEIMIDKPIHDRNKDVDVTLENGKSTTTITLKELPIDAAEHALLDGTVLSLSVNNGSDNVIMHVNGNLLKSLFDKNAVIELRTSSGIYQLPTRAMNIDRIFSEAGTGPLWDDIELRMEMNVVAGERLKVTDTGLDGAVLVTPGLEINVTVGPKGKEAAVSPFQMYVQRMMPIPDGIAAGSTMTGVMISTDGKLHHVPTRLMKKDGKTYAVISSLSNSLYAVIANHRSFTDTTRHWAGSSIENLASRLVVQGVDDTHFLPNRSVSRAEFTAMVTNAMGVGIGGQAPSFTDVPDAAWYRSSVQAATNNGLISGYANHSFKPDAPITREEAVVILAKAMKLARMDTNMTEAQADAELGKYGDKAHFHDWSKIAAALNSRYGIMNGSRGLAEPDRNISRAESAVMLERLLQKAGLIDSLDHVNE
ncbi:S-layer homology domain-containing protein [Paenibacillus chibensis]|uniref:S-layer homology domain-containing protein n=1 Tax=Paenibacillus chibensis TaxID=59846 RepID=A0ABU6PQV0_9BACL|nr:S-layer homology domain-containing protein [Paenibacillus chibensis]